MLLALSFGNHLLDGAGPDSNGPGGPAERPGRERIGTRATL